jgi:hypothetical protein
MITTVIQAGAVTSVKIIYASHTGFTSALLRRCHRGDGAPTNGIEESAARGDDTIVAIAERSPQCSA